MNVKEKAKREWKLRRVRDREMVVREGDMGEDVATVNNPLLFPVAVIDVLLVATLCALNYYLRYDPNVREGSSMVSWAGVRLSCTTLPSLSYPRYSPLNHTLTSRVAFALPDSVFFSCAIVVPCCVVILVEGVRAVFPSRRIKVVESCGFQMLLPVRRILRFLGNFLLGGSATGVLVSVVKLLVASPRPYLLAVCSPKGGNLGSMCQRDLVWSPETACGGDSGEVHEALRAFPSYHAALAVYCGVWTWVYYSRAAKVPGMYGSSLVMVGGVLVMTVIGAAHGCLTYQSSCTDVIAGGLIGAVSALYVAYGVLNGFKERKWRVKVTSLAGVPNHPNLLPVAPLSGSPTPAKQMAPTKVWKRRLSLGEEDSDDSFGYNNFALTSDEFPFIPRANAAARVRSKRMASAKPPAQAINSTVLAITAASPPPPPPPPQPTGPPPNYSRPYPSPWATTAVGRYNVPRQRYSAPAPVPSNLAYNPSRTLPHSQARTNLLFAYKAHDSDTMPRARTETSSYF